MVMVIWLVLTSVLILPVRQFVVNILTSMFSEGIYMAMSGSAESAENIIPDRVAMSILTLAVPGAYVKYISTYKVRELFDTLTPDILKLYA